MATIQEKVQEEALVADAFERVKADLMAVPSDQLLQLNVDVQATTRTILGALPELRAFREQLKGLATFDIDAFDKLEDYTLAFKYAQSNYHTAEHPTDDLDELTEQGEKLRERLLTNARALASHGVFNANPLEHLKGGNGYNNLAEDLELLSRCLTAEWQNIAQKSLTTLEDIQFASRVGLMITRLAGLREQGPARLAAATELRLRAFTVLFNTYEETREAVGYLRRRLDDVETIAPRLYAGRPRRRQPEDAQSSAPAQPVPVTPGGTSQAPPASPNGAASPQPTPKLDPRGPFIS